MADNITQPVTGYRYSLDPFLLAAFVTECISPAKVSRAVDLGTGNGIIAALLAKVFPTFPFVGIDIRKIGLSHARGNAPQSLFVNADIRTAAKLFPAGAFDLAVSNPPYRKTGDGRVNPDGDKAVSRHEVALTLEELIAAARHLLRDGGVFCVVHLAERTAELMHLLHERGFAPRTLRHVQSRAGEDAFLVLVEAVKGGRNRVTVKPPIIVYAPDGGYTAAVNDIYGKFDAL